MAQRVARLDLLNLLTVSKIFLFIQLFFAPLLLVLFNRSVLVDVIVQELYFPQAINFSWMSVAISIFGYVSFCCGSFIRLPCLASGNKDLDWHSARIARIFWVIFIAAYVYKLMRMGIGSGSQTSGVYFSLFGQTASFFMQMNWLHMLALSFLAIAYYENRNSGLDIANYYPFVLQFYLASGALNGSTFALMFPLATHLAIRQRYQPINRVQLIVFMIFILFSIYIKIFIKTIVIGDPENSMSFFAPLTFMVNRISVSYIISAIVDDTTFSYGYGMFEQFMYALRVPGYRYSIPDGNVFGRFYNIIDSNDYLTNIAISNLGDLMLHLGLIGVGLGMFMLGMLYRWAASLSVANSKLALLMYAMLWPIMVHGLESPVSLLIGNIARVIILCLFCYFLARFFFAMAGQKRGGVFCQRHL